MIDEREVGEALGGSAGKRTRVVASYDEDTISMGVEAARAALRGAPRVAPLPSTSRPRIPPSRRTSRSLSDARL